MWRALIKLALIVALIFGLCAGVWKALLRSSGWVDPDRFGNAATSYEWHVMGVYVLSKTFADPGLPP